MKTFKKEFDKLLYRLKTKENFAFSRFSDGELFIMQNKKIILADNHYITGNIRGANVYTEEEQKEFLPAEHQFYREKVIECFKHKQHNYFKGICTGTDPHLGRQNFDWQINLLGEEEENLTFSNLLINANYRRFIEEIVPLFVVKKTFEIGSNCMVNDYHIVEEVKEYIAKNNINDHLILCSAASLSNFVIYENYKEAPSNTYMDIGSCLNPLLDLEGWKYTRGYLTHYWLNSGDHFGSQVDEW